MSSCDKHQTPTCFWCGKSDLWEQDAINGAELWAEAAIDYIHQLPKGDLFTFDNVTAAVGAPPTSGVSGGVARRALKLHMIERAGFDTATRKTSHGRIMRVWRRCG